MSEVNEKVADIKKQVKNIDVVEVVKDGFAIVGAVAIVGGAAFLIGRNVHAAKAAEVVINKAPEVASTVAETAAEVVL